VSYVLILLIANGVVDGVSWTRSDLSSRCASTPPFIFKGGRGYKEANQVVTT
jgi:hypothetical protein